MYKDVWKRIFAFLMVACLIVTVVEWPTTVQAATRNEYRNGDGSLSTETYDAGMMAAIFTADKGSEAEVLGNVDFCAHVESGSTAKATLTYKKNVENGNPDSGTLVFQESINVKEGRNSYETGLVSEVMEKGSSFAIIVSLEGGQFYTYGGTGSGESYVRKNGTWTDLYQESGKCAAIAAYTYNATAIASRSRGADAGIAALSDTVDDVAEMSLNKSNLTVPEGWNGSDAVMLSNATENVQWSAADSEIVEVTGTGSKNATAAVIAKKAGTTTITAECAGRTFTCSVTVTPGIVADSLVLQPESNVYNGIQQLPGILVRVGDITLTANSDYDISYYANGDGTASGTAVEPDKDQNVFVNAGSYYVTVAGKNGYSGTAQALYTITPKSIADDTIEVTLAEGTTWEDVLEAGETNPDSMKDYITVTDTAIDTANGGTLLTYGADYSLAVSEDKEGVNISGSGNYEGIKYCGTPKSLERAEVIFDKDTYIYTGQPWKPAFSVEIDGVTISSSDYTVEWKNNTNAGDAADADPDATPMVTITGTGGYCHGTKAAYFTIKPKDIGNEDTQEIGMQVEVAPSVAGGDSAEPDLAVTYNNMTLVKDTDFTVGATVSIEDGKGQITLTGIGNYTGTHTVEYAVGTDIAQYVKELTVGTAVYDGTPQKPEVTLVPRDGMDVSGLAQGTDYDLIYVNNVDAKEAVETGAPTVILQGKGSYGGRVEAAFTITPADLDDAVCRFVDANGSEVSTSDYSVGYSPEAAGVRPEVVVKIQQGDKLVELPQEDYTLVYSVDNVTKGASITGTQTITISPAAGNSNLSRTKELTYHITRCSLTSDRITVTMAKENFAYTGAKIDLPKMTLTYHGENGDYVLEEGTDYTVSCAAEPKEIGSYSIEITGQGNYSGVITRSFWISAVDIGTLLNNIKIENANNVTDYDGPYRAMLLYSDTADKNKLQLTVKDAQGNLLMENDDYTLRYENYKELSKKDSVASVTITGRNNYYGSYEISYLLAADMKETYHVTVSEDLNLTYTGEPITLEPESITVSDDGILFWKGTLEPGVDYTVSYSDNENAGTGKVIIEAIPYEDQPTENGCFVYKDSMDKLEGSFRIEKRQISEAASEQIEKTYPGQAVEITADEISLTYNGHKLESVKDFEIVADSYDNNSRPTTEASVTVRGIGTNYTGIKTVYYKIVGKSLDAIISWKMEEAVYTGAALYPEIKELTLSDGSIISDPDEIKEICTYERDDYHNNINAGTGSITIHGAGEYAGAADKELTFSISPRELTNDKCTVNGIDNKGYSYTSQEITVPLTLFCTIDDIANPVSRSLTEEDYEVSYENNTNAGTASCIITGKGNYTGTFAILFQINPVDIDDSNTAITVDDIETQPYEGKEVRPVPVIRYDYGEGTYALDSAKDYTVKYTNANGPGTATIEITGRGNFNRTRSINFRIGTSVTDESAVRISCPELEDGSAEFIYTGSEIKPAVTVGRVSGNRTVPMVEGTDYTLTYKNNTDAGTATITVEGQGAYTDKWERTFTIQPRDLAGDEVTLEIAGKTDGSHEETYTGSPIEPEVTLKYQGKAIDVDEYTVTYEGEHTATGSVSVTVTGKDQNFTGTKASSDAQFTIVAASIGEGTTAPAGGFYIGAIEPQPKVEGGAQPVPTLIHNGRKLTYGTDYSCTYENNLEIGTNAYVILHGVGNYTGSVKKKFAIKGNIAEAAITVPVSKAFKDYVPEDATDADGIEVTFDDEIEVVLPDETELVKDTDYTVQYADNTWAGTAKVTIKGMGAWAGSVTKEVPITAELSEPGINVTISPQAYTGSPVEPVPVITYYGTALVAGTHFVAYGYKDNVEIGTETASVQIVGNEANGFSGSLTKTFSIEVQKETLTVSGVEAAYKYRGEQIKPELTVTYGTQTLSADEYTVTYGPNVNVGKNTGYVVVQYEDITESPIFFDIEPQNMAELTATDGTSASFAEREYTGEEIMPKVTLQAKAGNAAYVMPESAYTVEKAAGADNTSVGTGRLVLKGDGKNIIGEKEVTFPITPKSLAEPASGTADTITMVVTQENYTYDGTEKKPEVLVKYQYGTADTDERELVAMGSDPNADYYVTYSDNTNAGEAKVTITGMGNYKDSRTMTFTIDPKNLQAAVVELPADTYLYMGQGVAVVPETVTVTLDGVTLTENDYTVNCTNNTSVGTAYAAITGTGNYTGSTTKSYTITEHDIAAEDIILAEIPNQAYTGNPVIPELKITLGEYPLQKGRDYNLSITDNVEFGTATAMITGINGFGGERETTFVIAKGVDLAEVEGLAASYPYTGAPYDVSALGITSVKVGTIELSASDYSLAFAEGSDGMSIGTQTLVLTGQDEYGGQKELTITIAPKDIADADVIMTGFADSLPYAENLTQDITLTWGDITLVKDTDYTVTCSPSAQSGIYTMTVAGTGNYTGSIKKDFVVEQTALGEAEISGVSSTITYTGNAITPEPVVTMGGVKLTKGEDYTVSYENNVNVGTAKLVVTGTGKSFTGSKEYPFQISRRSIQLGTFGEIPDQIYTNQEIKPAVSVTDNGRKLVESKDYTVMYTDNRKAGVAKVSIGGKGNYTATQTLEFKISAGNVSSVAVTGTSNSTLTLGWTGQGVVTGYEIGRLQADGTYKVVARTRGKSYMDSYLEPGTAYSYKVRSYLVVDGETSYGTWSATVKGTTSK